MNRKKTGWKAPVGMAGALLILVPAALIASTGCERSDDSAASGPDAAAERETEATLNSYGATDPPSAADDESVAGSIPTVLELAMVRWQNAGGATSPRELNYPYVPPSENAAVVHRSAMESINALSERDEDVIKDPWSHSSEEIENAFRYIPRSLKAIHEAARMEQCNWDTDLLDEEVEQGRHMYLRRAVQILCAEAILLKRQDNAGEAVKCLEEALLIGNHLTADEEPLGLMSRHVTDRYVLETYRKMFDEEYAPPSDIASILDEIDEQGLLINVIRREGTVELHQILVENGYDLRQPLEEQELDEETARRAAEWLDHMIALLRTLEEPFYDVPEGSLPPEPLWFRTAPNDRTRTNAYRYSLFRSTMVWQSHNLVARTAMELRDYRRAHGEYPSVDDYVPPVDPYTGKPLHYRREGNGFLLHSPAKNGETRDMIDWLWRQ